MPRLFARIAQCAVCCDRSQPLIPGDDWAWQNRAQLFYKLEGFGRGRADLAIHSFGYTRHDMLDDPFTDEFYHSRGRALVCWNSFQRVRQQL